MALTAQVKDELARFEVTRVSARKAEVTSILRFSSALHLSGGAVLIESELDRPRRRAVCARRPAGSSATRRRSSRSPAEACAAAAGTSSASRRTPRRSPGRRASWTRAAVPSADCPRRSSTGRSRTARRPGAARSWRTARSRNPAAPPHSRSPAPVPRPPSPSWVLPAGSTSPRRPVRSAARTASSSATGTRSPRS